ncbi:MAG: MFS transporter [Leadbetterella sp.]|nr:MFS transporter [Leadbetterella sp.]
MKDIYNKIGLPANLLWGYLGILLFMMGDGMEQGWLSPYLIDRGLTIQHTATLFTLYGVTIAISSWFSGVLTETLNPRRTMLLGLVIYLIGTVLFISRGLDSLDISTLYITYALRGFGYPLFAYSFLVWISYVVPQGALGRAVGWFWFVFTGGLNVLGAFYSGWAIENLGHISALWSAVLWVLIGALLALVFNKARFPAHTASASSKWQEMLKGLTIMKEEPKVALGGNCAGDQYHRPSLPSRYFCRCTWSRTGLIPRNGCTSGERFLRAILPLTSFSGLWATG